MNQGEINLKYLVKLMIWLILTCIFTVGCQSAPQSSSGNSDEVSQNTSEESLPMIKLSFNEKDSYNAKDELGFLKECYVNYIFNAAKYKENEFPQWRGCGVSGGALLFDGYSTFIQEKDVDLPLAQGLSISVWVAPRAFEWGDKGQMSAIINQVDSQEEKGFIFGIYRFGQFGVKIGTQKGWYELMVPDPQQYLMKNQWSQIGVTYDAESGLLALYKNGEQIASKQFEPSPIVNSTKPLLIGKHNDAVAISAFSANMFNGMMDELMVYNQSITPDEMKKNYFNGLDVTTGQVKIIPWDDIKLDARILEDDSNRPLYHAAAPQHWMNEPHAPLYYNGKYHLFYQHNPFGPFWHEIHWGHWVSDDLIHWENLDVALSPEYGSVAPDGVWSGSACYDENGEPVLFFTAGNDSKQPNQAVAIATPRDLEDVNLEKWVMAEQTLIEQEPGQGILGQFRDPFVWYDAQTKQWFMLVCSGISGEGGTALAYSSKDMKNWEYKGPFYTSDYSQYSFLGQQWELPVLLPIKNDQGLEKYIFLLSPQGAGSDIEVYYFIGEFDKENVRFIPDSEEPQLIDLGERIFTGPSGFVDPVSGKTILFTITQGNREPWDEYYAGWAHNAGIPLELSLNDEGKLKIKPVEEVYSLRDELLVSEQNISMEEINTELALIQGDMLNIQITFKNENATMYGIRIRKTDDGIEQTDIYYDDEKKGLYVNRLKSSLDQPYKGKPGGLYTFTGDTLTLNILMDRSMVEIYANEEKSLTTRIYPTLEDALGLECFVENGNATIQDIKIWTMKSAEIE